MTKQTSMLLFKQAVKTLHPTPSVLEKGNPCVSLSNLWPFLLSETGHVIPGFIFVGDGVSN